jgi:2',3'-cyclic-nucleotide 2'-phosphodiesterase (5'-nucleotidase family)
MPDSKQNHDLDFGVAQFRHLRDQCQFPWLLANVLDPALGEDVPIGNCEKTCLLTSSNGIKVGVIGLGEREWYSEITLSNYQSKLTFSFVKAGNH